MQDTCCDTTVATLSDDALLDRLATEEDRLPREAVDEIVRRGERMIAPLTAICEDARAWEDGEDAVFWRQLHGAFILGAIGGEGALPGLLAALRHASENDVDWLDDALPSMLGRIGKPAIEPLLEIARDTDEQNDPRIHAIDGLAAIAAQHEDERPELLAAIRILVEDERDADVRGFAASCLLDFVRPEDRRVLLVEGKRQEHEAEVAWIGRADVETAYARGVPELDRYDRDWLEFYDPGEIERRQRRWADEKESTRWERGVKDGEPWVEEECRAAIDRYAASLADLDAPARDRALRIARSVTEFMTKREHLAPWELSRWLATDYLDYFAGEAAENDDIPVEDAAGELARLARFWVAEGRLPEHEAAEIEEEARAWSEDLDEDPDEDPDEPLDFAPLPVQQIRVAPVPGRNDPCPCASGKKYKRCCGDPLR